MHIETLLGIRLPIIQAPMASVQGSALALAVSRAGAMGSLPCAMLSRQALHDELSLLRAQGPGAGAGLGAFNLNFFCHTPPPPDAGRERAWRSALAPYAAELGIDFSTVPAGPGRLPFSADVAELLDEFKPPILSFHFGLPAPALLQRVRRWGAKILSTATTVEEGRWLQAQGADAVIAQGLEAGGHRGLFLSDDLSTQLGTLALVPQLVAALDIPVIAAGGIATAQGVAAALQLGAAAVQVGTAYLLCPEATTSAVHRAALKSPGVHLTALTSLFTGRPARGIVNRLMRELGAVDGAGLAARVFPHFPLVSAALAPLRAEAERRGSGDFSPLWAGQNSQGCKEISATALTRELARGLASTGRPLLPAA